MNAEERDAFLRQPHTAVIATVDARGRAHAVPVWYLYDGVSFDIVTARGSVKHKNILRTGRASLCIDSRGERVVSLTAEGAVTIEEPVTREWRRALHTHYVGAEEAARRVDASTAHEGMVMLRLTPERWLGYRA